MAEAKLTPTTKRVWDDGKKIHAVGTLTVAVGPDTYTAGGNALDFVANMVDGAGLGMPLPGISQQPFYYEVQGLAYIGQYNPVTKKLKIISFGGAEVAAGAVPAGLSGDAIIFYVIFDKMQ
jgi:hypothetical protein